MPLNSATLAQLKNTLFKYLNPKKDNVFIFGSWALGNNRTFSDIDIGVIGQEPLSTETKFQIESEFEESDLPYLVDVVDFNQVTDRFKKIALEKTIPL